MITAEPQPETPVESHKFLHANALAIANKFVAFLTKYCTRIEIAGSLRRRKQSVSDIEILFVPKIVTITDKNDMFGKETKAEATERAIDALLKLMIIAPRANVKGAHTWGPKNKLAVHITSGIPVDFFATTEECWWNALVVRTGPSESNKLVAGTALKRGWEWHAYGDGFDRNAGKTSTDRHRVTSERDAFDFVGLAYKEPGER